MIFSLPPTYPSRTAAIARTALAAVTALIRFVAFVCGPHGFLGFVPEPPEACLSWARGSYRAQAFGNRALGIIEKKCAARVDREVGRTSSL